jgi:hypothetical protein
MFESMGGIIHRTSPLDLGVRLSPHPAPEILGFRPAHVYVVLA